MSNVKAKVSIEYPAKVQQVVKLVNEQFGTRVHVMAETVRMKKYNRITNEVEHYDQKRPFVKTTVPRIKEDGIQFLAGLINDYKCEVSLVRSGTSITMLIKAIV